MGNSRTIIKRGNGTNLDWLISAGLFIFCITVYVLTLTPSLSFLSPDGSELATIPAVLGLAHMPGYPLYTWLGFLFSKLPFGDVAYRINLMSAFMAAVGVGGLYWMIIQILPKRPAASAQQSSTSATLFGVLRRGCAALAALTFAFSDTFWSQALIAEVYAVNIGMLALSLLLLLRWERSRKATHFFLFALVYGLSLGTHLSNLGFAPAFVVFILMVDARVLKDWRWWLGALFGFGLGIAQYAWLPLKASTLNDRMMLRDAPTTLTGIYNYTLGAFSQLKFAFPLEQIPDRVVLYLFMLQREMGWLALFLGVVGLFSLLLRRPKYFYLIILMYLVHVWFFIQYRVFDLEVFFIPAHFLWAILSAFGLYEGLAILFQVIAEWHGKRKAKYQPSAALRTLLAVIIFISLIAPAGLNLALHWEERDQSHDTAINDFYANVWALLPENAALLTQSGVFGYSAFYWQMIYDLRPDVLLPAMPTPNPDRNDLQDRVIFSTLRLGQQNRGPGALPPELIDQDTWEIPILIGENTGQQVGPNQQLVLYSLSSEMPELIVAHEPNNSPIADLGDLQLLSVAVAQETVEAGENIELTLYWRISGNAGMAARHQAALKLDEQLIARVPVGLGLIPRYLQQQSIPTGSVIEDHFFVVLPSKTGVGEQTLTIEIVPPSGETLAVDIGHINIIDEVKMVDGWFQIAGSTLSD